MEKACHQLCDEPFLTSSALNSTLSLGFHLSHTGRVPRHMANVFLRISDLRDLVKSMKKDMWFRKHGPGQHLLLPDQPP